MIEPRRPVPPALVWASDWAWRLLLVAAVVGLGVWGAAYLGFIVGPVVIALVVTALLEPVRRTFIRWGVRAQVAWLLTFVFGVAFVLGIAAFAVEEFTSNYDTLSAQTSDGVAEFSDWLETGPLRIRGGGLESAFDGAIESMRSNPSRTVTGTVSVLSTTGTLIAGGLLTIVSVFFFMKDRNKIWSWFVSLFPAEGRERVDSAGHSAWEVLISYTKVTLTAAIVDAVAIGSAALIAGVPVAFALAVLVFMFAFIPTIGAILSGLVVVLVTLVSQGVTAAIVLAIVVLLVQQVESNIMYPLLAQRHLALHPLASLLLVAGGGIVAGLFGAFVAVPVAAVFLATISDLRGSTSIDADSVPR